MKFLKALLIPAVVLLLPLLFKPDLFYRFEAWISYLGGFALILMQPNTSYLGKDSNEAVSDKHSKWAIALAVYLSMFASIFFFVYSPVSPESLGRWIGLCVGTLTLTFGICFRVWAIRILGKQFTTEVKIVDDHQLITKGPYKFLRHPSYTGATLMYIATPLLYAQWFLVPLVFFANLLAYHYRIKVEEEVLTSQFGDRYREYQSSSKKLIPFIY